MKVHKNWTIETPLKKEEKRGSVLANLEILQKMRDAVDYTLKELA
jgi:hypothetical protein